MFLNRAGVQNNYSHKVRVGNWSEEQEMEELRMKEYIHRKEKGQLLVHSIQKHMSASLAEVGLSHSADGLVHLGDHVMLYSVDTEGVLSCDPADAVASSDRGFAVTTSGLVKAHVARNTFVVEGYGATAKAGEPLLLGQQFRLRLNPALNQGQAYYLASQPVSALASSKVSRKQLVCMSSVKSFDTVWKVQWKDIARRFEQEGQPLPANSEVVLVHAATNTALSSSKLPYYNDFGLEYEVCAHSHTDIKKSQGLYAELQGRTTTDIPFRKESSPNFFAFLTAATEEMEEPLRASRAAAASAAVGGSAGTSSSASSLASVLANVREDLLSRGPDHLFSFLRSARLTDPKRSNHVNYDGFRKLLLQHGLKLGLSEFDDLCRLFDAAGDHHIDYLAFLAQIRGKVAELRAEAIDRVWANLDRSGSGSVSLQTLQANYAPEADPDVKLGRKGQSAALAALMDKFRAVSTSGSVARADFTEFYSIVSTFLESDDYFADLMLTCWSGKPAAAAAASYRQ